METEDLIKIRKEGGDHPKVPDVPSRVCFCGGVIFNSGRDENDDLMFESSCVKCRLTRQRTPEENEAISMRLKAEQSAYEATRLCTICSKSKPMPSARWCARCCIKMHTKDLNYGASSDSIVWAMNYAMKYL